MLKTQKGRVTVCGKDTSDHTIAELARDVGFVFQNPDHMIFADSVEEEVSFGPSNLGFEKEEIPEMVDNILAFTRLTKYKKEHPMSLSGGEKQRLALASIIVSRPRILILDEPTTGLDHHSVMSMVSLIDEMKRKGTTILLITHDMNLVTQVADRIVVMKGGKVSKEGSLHEVFSDKKTLESSDLDTTYALKLSEIWGLKPCITHQEIYDAVREMKK